MNRPRSHRESPALVVAKQILENLGRPSIGITGSATLGPSVQAADLRRRIRPGKMGLDRSPAGHGTEDRENIAAL